MSSPPGCLGLLLAPWKLFARPPARDLGIPPSVDPAEVARLLRTLTPPEPDGSGGLVWTEVGPEAPDGRLIYWMPTTPAERAEADRFVRAATYQSWSGQDDLRALLSAGRGPWLVRFQLAGNTTFVTAMPLTDDAEGPQATRPDHYGMTGDPAEAARLTADEAEVMILALTREYGIDPARGPSCGWFEPVPATQPWRDGRFSCLARD